MSIIIFLIILFLIGIHGKFLFNPDSSSFIVLRHIRLSTDNEQYRIRCPYNLNHLTLQLLNYSNDDCFNLYSGSNNNNNACQTQQSPCQFQAKSVQLHCNHHSYSNYVDITYQCSYKHTKTTFSQSTISDSSNQDEIISLFLIGLGIVLTIWIFTCCIWFICCHDNEDDDDDDDDNNSPRSYSKTNLSLHNNPFETNRISSLRTTQSV
jgi:hypothetical protein